MIIHDALHLPVCSLVPYVTFSTILIFKVKFKISYFQVPIKPKGIIFFTTLIFIFCKTLYKLETTETKKEMFKKNYVSIFNLIEHALIYSLRFLD